jgi:hypothetical protein
VKVLALGFFDPASVVLSHRDLMRQAGHDMRLAVVRAYTERQRQADWVLEQVEESIPVNGQRLYKLAQLPADLEPLREFGASADVIQFHPGIGDGSASGWASTAQARPPDPTEEFEAVVGRFGRGFLNLKSRTVTFIHGSNATRRYLDSYRGWLNPFPVAASTIDYAAELDAAYLPPLVDVDVRYTYGALDPAGKGVLGVFDTEQAAQKEFPGSAIVEQPIPRRAALRSDDDPLLVAHTPTDRAACSTAEFLKVAQSLGIPVKLGEGLSNQECLDLKASCNAGFDHLRGAFSVNTLENAALGLVSLHGANLEYAERASDEGFPLLNMVIGDVNDLTIILRRLAADPALTRDRQRLARSWWETYFSAEPITKRLVKFYEGL